MRIVDRAIKIIQQEITDKFIIEIACGCAEFTISASKIANEVVCIDLDDIRLNTNITEITNIDFHKMDATKTDYEDDNFDTVILYNAIGHLENCFESVINEALRIKNKSGSFFIISTFKMDKNVIARDIIPYLTSKQIPYLMSTE